MALHTINEGALVKVAPYKGSSGGVGVVKKKRRRLRTPEEFAAVFASINNATVTGGAPPSPPRFQFDIKYTGVETRLIQDVSPSRIAPYSFSTIARKRGGQATATRPSLLSTSHQPIRAAPPAVAVAKPRKETVGCCTPWLITLIEVSKKKGAKYQGGNKAMWYLWRKRADKGWLRAKEARHTGRKLEGTPKDEEKNLALKLYLSLQSCTGSAAAAAHAWGVERRTLYNWKEKAANSPTMVVARKRRADAGQTVFTSDSRRAATYTEGNIGPLRLFAARAKEGESISYKDASKEYSSASTVTIAIAEDFKERSPFLEAELKRVLSRTNGCISWIGLERALNEDGGGVKMVSASTIRRYITGTPGFSYKTTHILPFLNKGTIEKRLTWALQFWVFWESAKAFEGVQVVLLQMDEKWCYEIVVRKNNKSVPFFGVEPLVHSVQHKSHIGKVLIIASTAFLPANNDVTAGVEAVLVGLQRAVRMVAAERDTFARVYAPDRSGSYTYPKILANRLREKGKEYFESMEITGFSTGTKKTPKYPLTEFFADEMERLEVLVQKIESRSGKRVVVQYQMDGVGLHRDHRLLAFLDEELGARGWHLKFQPPNSPITNVKDACIFPSLSKRITAEQGLSNGGRLFSPDQLWGAIKLAWESFPLDTIARSYVMHHQVVNAIASCEGGDGFMREKSSFHANVRKCCVSTVDEEGRPTQPVNFDSRKFVYPKPDVSSHDPSSLTEAELELLYKETPVSHPLFGGISEAWAVNQLEDASSDED